MSAEWHILNGPESSIPVEISSSKPFKIATKPKTDIWRPDESADTFTAPFIYRKIKTSAFKRVAVSISAPWKTQYDQGGIAIAFPGERPWKWIKTGIEFYKGKPALSTVTADRFSDWSLCPEPKGSEGKARFEAVRDGQMLVINLLHDGEEQPLREIKWAFLEDRAADAEMFVGVYVAKPTPDEQDAARELAVTFEDLEMEVLD